MKRSLDLLVSSLGLIVLTPLLIVTALLIKLESSGPVFFRQVRIGRNGVPFRIHKFRTMRRDAENLGLPITVENDSRITITGKILRRWKLDELPQLIDVFLGKMSLVGPRPEVLKYVELYPADRKHIILSVLPGITDPASIIYRNENKILSKSKNPEELYINKILPHKIEIYCKYINSKSFFKDFIIILKTFAAILKD